MLPKGLLKEHSQLISMLVRIVDMAIIFCAGWFAYRGRFASWVIAPSYLTPLVLAILLTPWIFSFFNIYRSLRGKSFVSHIFALTQAILLLGFILSGLAFFTKTGEAYSRLWFAIWLGSAWFLLLLARCSILLILRMMREHGLNERRVVIFGASDLGVKLASTVKQALWTGFQVIAFIDDAAEEKSNSLYEIPLIKTPKALEQYLQEQHIDEIWLALPLSAEARVKEILFQLRHLTITTRLVLDIFGLDLLNHSITDVAGFPVLNIRSTPMIGINRIFKAIEDRLLAAIILILISPLLLMISLGVKWSSPGPILFRQRRLGCSGSVIEVYKFRTMVEHCEESGEITQATADDKRVTAFGRFLRRTSLDELPQFINVLQGRMSIVGPRPHALAHNEKYKDLIHTYMQRHHVKPGITGWAQVNGWRGETDTLEKMQKRVEYDLYYINNWSLWFDVKIIFLTLSRGFINPNAY